MTRKANKKPATIGRLSIEYVSRTSLTRNPQNPHRHSKRQIRQIAASLRAFGFIVPMVADAQGIIIAGEGRHRAAELVGLIDVPIVRAEHLNDAQKLAFMIADNRLTENSDWDENLLAEQFRELSAMDLSFELEVTGFEIPKIDLLIEGSIEPQADKPDPADAPTQLAVKAISCPGDLWVLGHHRIVCGDATHPDAYAVVMDGGNADFMFTDPPYNVPIDGHATGLGSIRHREFPMASGEMTAAEYTAFLMAFCRLAADHSRDGALHDICMDWRHVGELLAAGKNIYSALKNICVWVKHNAGMGSLYRSQHELVLIFKHGRKAHRNNIELGRHGRNRTNVWNYPGVNTLGRTAEEGNSLPLHPTAKPVALVADAILDCTVRGDTVLDPFLGSGTTLIAAERTGRRCCAIEIDPLYVDCAIRRWQAFTGDQARHVQTGRPFDELGEERETTND
jgi:DNA modification methylase